VRRARLVRYVREDSSSFTEKLTKGSTVVVAGTLNYEEYAKAISKTKSVSIKRACIDVKDIALV